MLSGELEATLRQKQDNLLAAQQLLQETGGLAEQRAQQNEHLKAQIEQVSWKGAPAVNTKQPRAWCSSMRPANCKLIHGRHEKRCANSTYTTLV